MHRRPITSILAAALGGLIAALVVVLVAPSSTVTTRVVSSSTGVAANALASDRQTHETLAHVIYERAAPGVVAILATTQTSGLFGGTQSDSGSGIVVGAKGLIITNNHVIAGANKIIVQFGGSSGPTRRATVVAVDASNDLALLSVKPGQLKLSPLRFGNSAAVRVGDPAFAIGNPFTFDQTLSLTSNFAVETTTTSAPITIAAPITLSGSNTLTLSAAGKLNVDANVTVTGTGTVSLTYNSGASTNLDFALGDSLQFNGTNGDGTPQPGGPAALPAPREPAPTGPAPGAASSGQ